MEQAPPHDRDKSRGSIEPTPSVIRLDCLEENKRSFLSRAAAAMSSSEEPNNNNNNQNQNQNGNDNNDQPTLEERMKRKMAEFDKPKQDRQTAPAPAPAPQAAPAPSLEDRMRRKMAEFDDNNNQNRQSAPTPTMAPVLQPPTPVPTLEERMRRKMAEFDNNNQDRETAPAPAPSLEDRMRRKMAEFNNNNQNQQAAPTPTMAPVLQPLAPVPTLEERVGRKMAEFDNNNQDRQTAPAPAPASQGQTLSLEDRVRRKTAEYDQGGNGQRPAAAANPSLEDRMGRKMAAYSSGGNKPSRDEELGAASSISGSSTGERYARKMAAVDRPNNAVTRTAPRQGGEVLLEMSLDDAAPVDFDLDSPLSVVSPANTERRDTVASLPTDSFSPFASAPSPGLLEPTTTLAKQRPPEPETGGTPVAQQPGAYSVQGRAVGALPAWGRRLRSASRSIRNMILPPEIRRTNPQSDLPSELRTVADTASIPPELRTVVSEPDTSLPPELRTVAQPEMTHQDATVSVVEEMPEQQESQKPSFFSNRRNLIIIGVAILVIAGVVVGVVFALGGGGKDKSNESEGVVVMETPAPVSPAPSAPPTASSTVCPATLLNYAGAVVSCNCNNMVDVPQEVLDQYVELTVLGFPKSVIAGFSEQAGSCDPTNVALYWLADDIIKTGNSNFQSRRTRYILAILFLRWTTSSRGVQSLDDWTRRDGWLSQTHECTWFGLSCENNSLVQMELANNRLQLKVLADELFLLTDLKLINLAENSIFPSTIPTVISQLTRLEVLNLRGNAFTGVIPGQLFRVSSLRLIDIGLNNIAGSVPTEIAQLSNLEAFLADNNLFVGGIPTQIANLTRLAQLDLSENQIGGNMPTQIWSLASLEVLNLTLTILRVTLGPEMGAASSLQVLSLQGLGYRTFTSIPTEIGMLTRLRALNLQNPLGFPASTLKLRGTLPTELGLLTDLAFLAFGDHRLFGTIPSEIGALTMLQYLNLGDNMLDGSIPPEIMVLPKVVLLNLGNNNLEGSIPTIVNTPDLLCFDVSANDLTGSVPEALCDSTPVAISLECRSLSDVCTCCSCMQNLLLQCFVSYVQL